MAKDYKILKTVECDGFKLQKGRRIDQSQIPNDVFMKVCWADILEPLDGTEPPNDSAEVETEAEVEPE